MNMNNILDEIFLSEFENQFLFHENFMEIEYDLLLSIKSRLQNYLENITQGSIAPTTYHELNQ